MKRWFGFVYIPAILAIANFVSVQFCASQSKPTETITAATILERWAQAVGGKDRLQRIENSYTRAVYEGTAGSGIVEEWQTSRGQRKQSNNLTSSHEINVFNGSTGWVSQNQRVREFSRDESEAALSPAYIGSNSHLLPGRLPGTVEYLGEDQAKENYVLKITPQGGKPRTVYVDKKTFLPIRQEGQLTRTNLTVEINGWREVEGMKIPAQLRMTTSDGYEAIETIKEARVNLRLANTFFDRPPEGPRDYRFTSGQSALGIPIEIGSGHIFLRGQINDSQPMWFVLDTAASGSLLDLERAQQLGLKLFGQPTITGIAGSVTGSYARQLSVKLPGAEMRNQTFLTLPLAALSASEGRAIDGILGYDFFHRFVVEIDYSRKVVNLFDPKTYNYHGKGEVIPFSLHSYQPYVRAKLMLSDQNQIESEFVVDTGSGNSLMLARDFAEQNNVLSFVKNRQESKGRGVGGQVSMTVGRMPGMQLGSFTISEPVTLFPNGEITAPGKAGNIGSKILRRFRVVVDYSRLRMILEPTERFAERDRWDLSGVALIAEGADLKIIKILRVRENSSAALAGLKSADIIVSINNEAASEIGLGAIREMFTQEGRGYQLVIKRGSETLQIKLQLRESI